MSLRSLTEIKSRDSRHPVISRFVVPAKAGIQVCCPTGLAWIPAFGGMTNLDRIAGLYIFKRSLYAIIVHWERANKCPVPCVLSGGIE